MKAKKHVLQFLHPCDVTYFHKVRLSTRGFLRKSQTFITIISRYLDQIATKSENG